jgi:GNAT superfamily N-acetyltransferase
MEYTVTEALDDDIDEIAVLEAELINTGQRLSRRYLEWKYRQNPFIPGPLLFVVRHSDEIVAVRGMYGTRWNLGTGREAIVLPHADDLMIREEHRNRGLFLLLHRAMVKAARAQGFEAILSLSGVATTQELSLACGYRTLDDLDSVQRPAMSDTPLLRRGEGRVLRGLRTRGIFSPAFGLGATVNGVCRQITATARNPRIDVSSSPDLVAMSTLAAASATGRIGADRSEDFLRWRLANPDHIYRVLHWRDPELRGYLVLSWDVMRPGRVTIADVVAENDAVFSDLLAALVEVRDVDYVMMSTTLGRTRLHIAENAGFTVDRAESTEHRRRFLYFMVNASADSLVPDEDLERRWRVSELDLMTC